MFTIVLPHILVHEPLHIFFSILLHILVCSLNVSHFGSLIVSHFGLLIVSHFVSLIVSHFSSLIVFHFVLHFASQFCVGCVTIPHLVPVGEEHGNKIYDLAHCKDAGPKKKPQEAPYFTEKAEELKCGLLLNLFKAQFLVENVHLEEVLPTRQKHKNMRGLRFCKVSQG